MTDKMEVVRALESLIEENNTAYYVKNAPTIPDAEYDRLLVSLREMREKLGLTGPSVLDRPGSDLSGGFKEVKHLRPMLSIRTEVDTSDDPIRKFHERVCKALGTSEVEYIAEDKYDGLAISLRFERGWLESAVTRGNGEVGEDVLINVREIYNMPRCVAMDTEEIRGEVLLPKHALEMVNAARVRDGEVPYVNCRNAAAGILRKKEGSPYARWLDFKPYSLFKIGEERGHETQESSLRELRSIFARSDEEMSAPVGCLCRSVDDLYEYYHERERGRADIPYDIDGIVYKVNRVDQQDKLGVSGREPRWSMAHKFNPEQAPTVLMDIDVQIGPSGRATPVARLKPVFVGGTTVTNVTLSNIFQIRKKNLRIGDHILVHRAGDVIPEIVKNTKRDRTPYVPNFRMPLNCPSCGEPLIRNKGEVNSFCANSYGCEEQFIAQVERLGSRKILDIDGLGPSIGQMLWDSGADTPFLILKHTEDDLMNIGVSEGVAVKLGRKIQECLNTPLPAQKFIEMLNIPSIGGRMSTAIIRQVGSVEGFLAVLDNLESIRDLTSLNIREIKDFFGKKVWMRRGEYDASMIELVRDMTSWFKLVSYVPNVDGVLSGKTIVVTGSEPGISREGFKAKIQELGAKLGSSVTKFTTVVVYGDGAGDKLNKAEALGVLRMTYSEFLEEFPMTRPT